MFNTLRQGWRKIVDEMEEEKLYISLLETEQRDDRKVPSVDSTFSTTSDIPWINFAVFCADLDMEFDEKDVLSTFKSLGDILSATFPLHPREFTVGAFLQVFQQFEAGSSIDTLLNDLKTHLGDFPDDLVVQTQPLASDLFAWRRTFTSTSFSVPPTLLKEANPPSNSMEQLSTVKPLSSPCKSQETYSFQWLESQLGSSETAFTLLQKLHSLSPETLQEDLLLLLGESKFDLMSEIYQNRLKIIDSTVEMYESTISSTPNPSLPPNFSVESTETRSHRQKRRQKWTRPSAPTEIPLQKDFSLKKGSALPSTAERFSYPTHDEVYLPAPPPTSKPQVPLIKVSESLDSIGQLVFKGISHLNALQSQCFQSSYLSNENILVCAPTGAGKTNVAMLTVLHELQQHITTHRRSLDFKIIYVAPMKALAQEIVRKFTHRLSPLHLTVKELTGDTQLTRTEIENCQVIVTTPEKWDIVTRKAGSGGTDEILVSRVKLLIFDEIHLLHEERGAVIESIVARTLRQVEASQTMIRIVGLSATLPNPLDVAAFLRVSASGLLVFGSAFRPVPLDQRFIGVKGKGKHELQQAMVQRSYDKVIETLQRNGQVMVFVHSRKQTVTTAKTLIELHCNEKVQLLQSDHPQAHLYLQKLRHLHNNDLITLFPYAIGFHHAGMRRNDRSLVEEMFSKGILKVLCCTATLAWGVNLPAQTVIIQGTDVYAPEKGGWTDLGILDVLQIFGRAGRPQFASKDNFKGEGVIICARDRMDGYIRLLLRQTAIESQLYRRICDTLNAEIVLGTVLSLGDAISWLKFTYFYVRMRKNPMHYGISYQALVDDPQLTQCCHQLVTEAARALVRNRMVRFDERSGALWSTRLGSISSFFYVTFETVTLLHEKSHFRMDLEEVLALLAMSQEFSHLQSREEEQEELSLLMAQCPLTVKGGTVHSFGKVSILIQSWISRLSLRSSSLTSDTFYISQNIGRVSRALFEYFMSKKWTFSASNTLTLCRMIDQRVWDISSPLRQFSHIPKGFIEAVEGNRSFDQKQLEQFMQLVPRLEINAQILPLTRTILRIDISLFPVFKWTAVHGQVQMFHLWVLTDQLVHSELIYITPPDPAGATATTVQVAVPIGESMPDFIRIKTFSHNYIGGDSSRTFSLHSTTLPISQSIFTPLLHLRPLPVSAVPFPSHPFTFTHFNPIQTQVFHNIVHSPYNSLICAPTGSGKTAVAELAMLSALYSGSGTVVYIAPLKALVREKLIRWSDTLPFTVSQITGDSNPLYIPSETRVILTTPEKWDVLTRKRSNTVQLIVIDEIHLLSSKRGAVLESIVSRTRRSVNCRLIALSTALSNAEDLAQWLQVPPTHLYNFSHALRPVPLSIHVSAFTSAVPAVKPLFRSILSMSPSKPVLIFVPSRHQTRSTALTLISLAASEGTSRRFSRMTDSEVEMVSHALRDQSVLHLISFGIAVHHAGMHPRDLAIVEGLFQREQVQIMVATSTLAWGVNVPAHLVLIHGTQYWDNSEKVMKDLQLTDVLQMVGRAGRPQFDSEGSAVVFVSEGKKEFYAKFMYESFPVESQLLENLEDMVNAELCGNAIDRMNVLQSVVEWVSYTFLFQRILKNPSFYQCPLDSSGTPLVTPFVLDLVQNAIANLHSLGCVQWDGNRKALPTPLGRIASFYYIKCTTVSQLASCISERMPIDAILKTITETDEFDCKSIGKRKDLLNLSQKFNSANFAFIICKCLVIGQNVPFDDIKRAVEPIGRVLGAFIDIAAGAGYLETTLHALQLSQQLSLSENSQNCNFTVKNLHCNLNYSMRNVPSNSMWWIVAGLEDGNQLLAFKRITARSNTVNGSVKLVFPEAKGIFKVTVYLAPQKAVAVQRHELEVTFG